MEVGMEAPLEPCGNTAPLCNLLEAPQTPSPALSLTSLQRDYWPSDSGAYTEAVNISQ